MNMDMPITGVRADISEMLSKMREISNKSKVFSEAPSMTQAGNAGFENALAGAKDAMSHVASLQADTETLRSAYVTGDSHATMAQVIVASQKSKLAFEGLLAVRNKILDAYKEIMSMPV
jgi:flagellar hook-basal body complex protein FliE